MQIRLLFAAAAALSLTAGVATAQRTSTDLNASPTTMNTGQGSQMRVQTAPARGHGQGQTTAYCSSNEILVTAKCGAAASPVIQGGGSNNSEPRWGLVESGNRQGASCNVYTNNFNGQSYSPSVRLICATR